MLLVLGVSVCVHFSLGVCLLMNSSDRGVLKIVDEEFPGHPIIVAAELILGLYLCFWAALTVPGKFLSILPDSEENRNHEENENNLYCNRWNIYLRVLI
ncbi:membrane magnesium transporter [Cinnamomum micranthum f. kanehirae]|uniref:Membrane magnesium transporter n=1 Tax=Cinnamomum micranthum f. kanehirae TaxID=337451 RepID=A0A3S3N3C7_9MAGN|nr:membrane magnesium transporter [Cinnamomum micranthum f. kanehirae]